MEKDPEYEFCFHSHRGRPAKFVRVDAKKRDSKAHAIITCEKDRMAEKVEKYQDENYDILDIKEMK